MKLEGEIRLPGDKSITHRALLLSAISHGEAKLINYLISEDTKATINALKSLGVSIDISKEYIKVVGRGFSGLKKPSKKIDCQNSGTTARLLLGLLSGLDFESILVGDESLSKRPMGRVVKHLLTLKGKIFLNQENYLPARILPSKIEGGEVFLDVSSAQVKSAVILAALKSEMKTIIHEISKSRDHTELLLKYLGCDIETNGLTIKVSGKNQIITKDISIPGDISSAAYFIIAALLIPNSKIIIKDCLLNPTRMGIFQVLRQCGAQVNILNEKNNNYERYGDILVEYTENLQPFIIDKFLIPYVLDEIPILALLATRISGTTIIKDASELRLKETDRLKALKINLSLLGCNVIELADGLVIKGKTKLKPNTVDSYGDHRLSMMLKVARLICENIEIKNGECDKVSYPSFENDLIKLIK